ncbi:YbaB/EbfC family nucleoid-associated protein [Actinoplanes sp. NPDC020271]|uniref:YbaB/EbfC family nucleoid-associated protein n=1 Tax=Actinoplanes sp. NPDC020271 TaxID=3363896 RepID=UPI003794FB94
MAEDLGSLSDRLRLTAQAAQTRHFQAADRGGLAEVTVDGRPRVAELRLHRDALSMRPDELDNMLTTVINQALQEARSATHEAILDALPSSLRQDADKAAGQARP